MDNWGLLIGTLAGFITAFLAEPIKMYFQYRDDQRKVKIALYREIESMYSAWKGFLELVEQGKVAVNKDNILVNTRIDLYNYLKGQNPLLFYSLRESGAIDVIYRNFISAKDQALLGDPDLSYASSALMVVEKLLKKKKLDRELFNRLVS